MQKNTNEEVKVTNLRLEVPRKYRQFTNKRVKQTKAISEYNKKLSKHYSTKYGGLRSIEFEHINFANHNFPQRKIKKERDNTLPIDATKTYIKDNSAQRLPEINTRGDSRGISPNREYVDQPGSCMPSLRKGITVPSQLSLSGKMIKSGKLDTGIDSPSQYYMRKNLTNSNSKSRVQPKSILDCAQTATFNLNSKSSIDLNQTNVFLSVDNQDPIETVIAEGKNLFAEYKNNLEIRKSHKILRSAVGRLNFTNSSNFVQHVTWSHSEEVKMLHDEIAALQEKLVDFEMLKTNLSTLQEKYNSLLTSQPAKKTVYKVDKRVERYNKINFEKYIPNSRDFVPISKYNEVADKLIKERLRNEKLREDINCLKDQNKYINENSNELVSIFESFIRATDLQMGVKGQPAFLPGKVGRIPRVSPKQDLLINTQFKNLENFVQEYNVLKTCIETNKTFKDKLDNFQKDGGS
ncbi:unnamed protein product [Moneuplotes crassus]|uniref:Uncharacterized protein n=1 Tax=Euplotes crassus TaxID=5936 RepID=A0AAD1UJD8_EUPCR|nr:unnamed protein product [Moneuplotes crassus]